MKRFSFRLEKLLSIRRHREREWELELAAALGEVIATRSAITSARQGIVRSLGAGRAEAPRVRSGALVAIRLDQEAIVSAERYREGMEARIRELEARLQLQERRLEEVRASYLEASRDRKLLDKLKERQETSYRRAQTRAEIAVLNEIATSRAVRWQEAAAEPEGGAPAPAPAGPATRMPLPAMAHAEGGGMA